MAFEFHAAVPYDDDSVSDSVTRHCGTPCYIHFSESDYITPVSCAAKELKGPMEVNERLLVCQCLHTTDC
eukprot:755802-Hanusia_phi.AAC.1